jgi:hypothetical protein
VSTDTELNDFIVNLNICGISGKAVLNIQPGTYGVFDLTTLSANKIGVSDTLIIQSATGIASDVVFTAPSATSALTLAGLRNTCFHHITFDASSGKHGVEFTGVCDNVEFNACHIIGSTASTTNANGCGVFYLGTATSASMGMLRFTNNTINYGYYGLFLSYLNPSATAQAISTNRVRITDNTIEDPYYSGICTQYYCSFDTIARNVINTRALTTDQGGISLSNAWVDGGIIGNVMNIRTTGGGFLFQFSSLNSTAIAPALVANNEIKKLSGSGTTTMEYILPTAQ